MSLKHRPVDEREAILALIEDFESLAAQAQRGIDTLAGDEGASVMMARLETVKRLAEQGAELARLRLNPV